MKIKLFENFKNDGRDWRLSYKQKSKLDKEINNALIELIDSGFKIETDYFSKKIAGDNSILVSVHKINNNERFNTDEVKDNFLVLLDYMNENYGVKEHNYDVEIIGAWPNNRAVSEEYPDNLEVIEIDIDITI